MLTATGDEAPLLERRIERLMNWSHTPRLQLTCAGMAGVMMAFVSLIVLPAIAHSWAQAQAPGGDSELKEHVVAQDTVPRDIASPAKERATRPVPSEQTDLPRSADGKVIRGTVVDQQGSPIAGRRSGTTMHGTCAMENIWRLLLVRTPRAGSRSAYRQLLGKKRASKSGNPTFGPMHRNTAWGVRNPETLRRRTTRLALASN